MMPAPKFPQYKTVPTASLIPYARCGRNRLILGKFRCRHHSLAPLLRGVVSGTPLAANATMLSVTRLSGLIPAMLSTSRPFREFSHSARLFSARPLFFLDSLEAWRIASLSDVNATADHMALMRAAWSALSVITNPPSECPARAPCPAQALTAAGRDRKSVV